MTPERGFYRRHDGHVVFVTEVTETSVYFEHMASTPTDPIYKLYKRCEALGSFAGKVDIGRVGDMEFWEPEPHKPVLVPKYLRINSWGWIRDSAPTSNVIAWCEDEKVER